MRLRLSLFLFAALVSLPGEDTKPPQPKDAAAAPAAAPTADAPNTARTELNLLGQTDSQSGESRRNENVQFNLVDNNAQKELNQRIGVTATLIGEFTTDRPFFGAEFGPTAPWTILRPAGPAPSGAWHGALRWSHMNSATSARAFFQVGGVKPARDNDVGASAGGKLWRGAWITVDGSVQANRGMVNGNIQVPLPGERTPLATDPRLRALVASMLASYPDILPNRTDIDQRMANTNAPQGIDNRSAQASIQQSAGAWGQFGFSYGWVAQRVDAFQLVKGQNPDTTTRAHKAGIHWTKSLSAATLVTAAFRFDRVGTVISPDPEGVPYGVFPGQALTPINGASNVPINRAQNIFKTEFQIRSTRGRHNWSAGAQFHRQQLNGYDSDAHIPQLSFNRTATADAITNLRLGTPITLYVAIGYLPRGFRWWDHWMYASDTVKVSNRLTMGFSLGYRPVTRPTEVNQLNTLPYSSDWNNFGPMVSLAYRPAKIPGVFRAAWGVHYGEIFPVTFQQVRFNLPLNRKLVLQDVDLLNPLAKYNPSDPGGGKAIDYAYSNRLVSPYSQTYSASWTIPVGRNVDWQLGYTGSRSLKLLYHNHTNRGRVVPGIPLRNDTVDLRRADQTKGEVRRVENMSRGYYDAFRTTITIHRNRALQGEVSYWFSKALDLGADYTGTANDIDSFRGRAQTEENVVGDMKGRSRFDQPNAFLARVDYSLPRAHRQWIGAWSLFGVALAKSGTPFQVTSGSDAPGFGNADGVSMDRPDIVDPSILGRAITHPDISQRLLPRSGFRFMAIGAPRGNLGRNTFRRAPIRNLNAGVAAHWAESGPVRVEMRVESNNLTNTPQFAEPGFSLTDPNFGVITNTLNDGRSFRMSLRLGF